MQEEFKLETLPEFEGGKVRAAFNKHVHRAALDCAGTEEQLTEISQKQGE